MVLCGIWHQGLVVAPLSTESYQLEPSQMSVVPEQYLSLVHGVFVPILLSVGSHKP